MMVRRIYIYFHSKLAWANWDDDIWVAITLDHQICGSKQTPIHIKETLFPSYETTSTFMDYCRGHKDTLSLQQSIVDYKQQRNNFQY